MGCKPLSLLQNLGAYGKIILVKKTKARLTALESGITLLNNHGSFCMARNPYLVSQQGNGGSRHEPQPKKG